MRAKERLTGAIILVVLIVLVVPELLTGPRRETAPDIGTSGEGAPMRSYTIELGERSAAKPAQPAQPRNHAAQNATTPPPPEEVAAERAAPQRTEPAPVPVAKPAPEAPLTGWSVQVGSFASRENADRLTGELRRLGYRSFVTEGTNGGRKLYRVRVGPEADRAAARRLAKRLEAAEHPGAIVPHP